MPLAIPIRRWVAESSLRATFPRSTRFVAMRYYAGNWDSHAVVSVSRGGQDRSGHVAIASMPAAQLERFYGKDRAQIRCICTRVFVR